MKRAVATITVYVYGETEEELSEQGKEIANYINNIGIDSRAEMEELHEVPFGKIGTPKPIKFKR